MLKIHHPLLQTARNVSDWIMNRQMWNISRTWFLLVLCFSLLSCRSPIEEYVNTKPEFHLDQYFDGPVIAWGIVQDYRHKVTRRFCVEMTGRWELDEQSNTANGILDEYFYYSDGTTQQRIWYLKKSGKHTYEGTASDVIGQASGRTAGYGFQWQYTLAVTIDDTEYEFVLDDWMYQLDKHRVINRTAMKKLGIPLADITLFFDKEQPLRSCNKGATAPVL